MLWIIALRPHPTEPRPASELSRVRRWGGRLVAGEFGVDPVLEERPVRARKRAFFFC